MPEITNRRRFIYRTGQLVAGGLLGSSVLNAQAADAPVPSENFYEMPTSTEGKCATCEFWGGVRRLTKDRKQVLVQSLGWCNNPTSRHYQQLTTPETGPMESWKKWGALA
jgi:hypothetical protein